MELDDLSLELGLHVDTTTGVLDSDSDYSSIENEMRTSEQLLFPEADLHGSENSYEEDISKSAFIDPSFENMFDICPEECSSDSGSPSPLETSKALQKSPTVFTVNASQCPMSGPKTLPIASKLGPNDSPNLHDYARLKEPESLGKQAGIFNSKLDFKKILLSCNKQTCQVLKPSNVSEKQQQSSRKSIDIENSHMTKNAIAARENRLKKKQYIQTLETKVDELSSENESLKKQVSDLNSTSQQMLNELEYLRRVLSNVDEISSLVKGIKKLPGFQEDSCKNRLKGDVCKKRKSGDNDKVCVQKKCKVDNPCSFSSEVFSGSSGSEDGSPGICVHVRGSSLSLELCHHCSKQAQTSHR